MPKDKERKLQLNTPSDAKKDFIFYTTPNGEVRLHVFLQDETIWLSQKMMAELFDVEVNTINYHLSEVYENAELEEVSTIRKIRIVQKEGNRKVSRKVDFLESSSNKNSLYCAQSTI